MPKRSVLVTGAAGRIGSYFCKQARGRYRLTMLVHHSNTPRQCRPIDKCGQIVVGDVGDVRQLSKLFRGIDTVLHLAGDPSPNATWDSVLQNNIIGTYNVLLAAKAAGCRRVVYASSIHAVSGYPPDVQVHEDDPVNPGDLYGVSKCFGEALARYMANQEGLSCIVLRIGAFQPPRKARGSGGVNMLDAWISQRDLFQLLCKSIDIPDLSFALLHGLSNNRFKRLDIRQARRLVGYEPQDDSTRVNPQLRQLKLNDVSTHNIHDGYARSAVRKHARKLKRK